MWRFAYVIVVSSGVRRHIFGVDSFDAKLLALVQRDNRQTNERLGEQVGLSPTAVRRRLRRLREDGVIVGDVSLVDPAALGITVIIRVRLEKESHATYEAFKTRMIAAEEVSQVYTVSGPEDFVVIAHLPDLPAYDRWIAENLLSDDSLARSDTNIVYNRVKYDTRVTPGPGAPPGG